MLWAATKLSALAHRSFQDKMSPLLPKLSEAKMVSFQVALAVAEQARAEGLAQMPDTVNMKDAIRKNHVGTGVLSV